MNACYEVYTYVVFGLFHETRAHVLSNAGV